MMNSYSESGVKGQYGQKSAHRECLSQRLLN